MMSESDLPGTESGPECRLVVNRGPEYLRAFVVAKNSVYS